MLCEGMDSLTNKTNVQQNCATESEIFIFIPTPNMCPKNPKILSLINFFYIFILIFDIYITHKI